MSFTSLIPCFIAKSNVIFWKINSLYFTQQEQINWAPTVHARNLSPHFAGAPTGYFTSSQILSLSLTRSAWLVPACLASTNVFNTFFKKAALTLSWLDKCQKWRPLHSWPLTSHSGKHEQTNPCSKWLLISCKGRKQQWVRKKRKQK